MPQSKSKSTIARQWELLKLLPRHGPGRTSGELHQSLVNRGYKTLSKRTVERDLNALQEVFKDQIHWNAESRPHGWHWKKHAGGPLRGMDVTEAVSFALLEDLLKQLVPADLYEVMEGRFVEAKAKLNALGGNAYAQWREVVRYVPPGLPFPPPSLVDGVLETVQDALLRLRRLRVTYRGTGKPQAKERILDPLALIQLGERSYLVAGDGETPEPKSFALHRIKEAEVLDEKIHGWDGFSLDEYLQKGNAPFGAGKLICLRARIDERLKLHFEESPIAEDQKLHRKNGKWFVSATVRDTLQLEFWILSWSSYLEVLEPTELRERIQCRFREAIDGYGRG